MTEAKIDFAKALKEAQAKGFAERKPHLDVEGIDTLHKLCILAYICFGVWPKLENVYTEGITKISLLDIIYAEELNYRIKLLAIAHKENHMLDLRVHPALVNIDHPLAEVDDAYNAAFLDTHPAGQLLFYGLGAGGTPTSSSVISDIVNISLGSNEFFRGEEKVRLKNIKDVVSRYYIRFMAKDRPGVLAQIAKILAVCEISIASVKQKEISEGRLAPIVMITHKAKEENLQKAMLKIGQLSMIKQPIQVIRIEDL
jgi:homoserine dehydrogenase